MKIENLTSLPTLELGEMLTRAVEELGDHSRLRVRITWARPNCRQTWTGVCKFPASIRVSLNPGNRYPVTERLASGVYVDRRKEIVDGKEWHFWRQLPNEVIVSRHEELALLGFLHEYSHFLDHQVKRNTRFKQTQADKFAFAVIQGRFPEIKVNQARRP